MQITSSLEFRQLKEKKVGLKPIREAEENAKHLEEYQRGKPRQMELFEFIQPVNREYSNTVELYDFMPKYVWGKVERIGGKFLRNLRREFECRETRYGIDIAHGRLRLKDDSVREFYYPRQA